VLRCAALCCAVLCCAVGTCKAGGLSHRACTAASPGRILARRSRPLGIAALLIIGAVPQQMRVWQRQRQRPESAGTRGGGRASVPCCRPRCSNTRLRSCKAWRRHGGLVQGPLERSEMAGGEEAPLSTESGGTACWQELGANAISRSLLTEMKVGKLRQLTRLVAHAVACLTSRQKQSGHL